MANPPIGRGGRGAALQQLLSQQIRRPGDAPSAPPQTQQPGAMSAAAAAAPAIPLVQSPPPPVASPVPIAGQQPVLAVGVRVSPEPLVAPRPGGGRGAAFSRFLGSSASSSPGSSVAATPLPHSGTPDVGAPSLAAPRSDDKPSSRTSGLSSMEQLGQALDRTSISPPATVSDIGGGDAHGTERTSFLQRFVAELATDTDKIPKIGTAGQPVPLSTNYIALRSRNAGVYQYCVAFSPEIDALFMRHKLLESDVAKGVMGAIHQFDGRILFLPIKLPEDVTVMTVKRPTDDVPVVVTIRLTNVLKPEQCLPLFNITFRRALSKLKMCQVGRDYYLPQAAAPIPKYRLEVWPGYITAIDRYEGGLLMLTDVKHRVLRTITVLDVIMDCVRANKATFREESSKRLIGSIVLTRYNNRTYRIDDIAWDKTPMTSFETATEPMTFIEYYKKSYNKEIRDPQQPLLVHIPKAKDIRQQNQGRNKNRPKLDMICLIPEFCFMTGLSDDMRSDFSVMKEVAVHTRVPPAKRREELCKLVVNLNQNPEARAEFDKWGLSIDEDIMKITGRLLPPEMIRVQGREMSAGNEADWSRDLCRSQVLSAVNVTNWLLVVTTRDQGKASDFVEMYVKCARDMGIRVERPMMAVIPDDRNETYIREVKTRLTQQTQLVVVIFPTSRDDRYRAIKRQCCVESPVPSQVINSKTISAQQKLRSVTQKIALQINCKLGGELWGVKLPTKGLMVCGIDTYHEGAGKSNSVGGFVCSINESCTRWYSRVCIQMRGEELMSGLKVCFLAALRKYHEVNHSLPKYIFIFRDGVGDGQLSYVQKFEVPQLSECFPSFGDYNPKMVFVVVQKRINQRIFALKGNGPNQLDNPLPGTIVDHTITRRQWDDFFLVSQHVRQGTVSPTHYVVVHDTMSRGVDSIQSVTYKMTHMYYNWPGTVRVPAPCQYAHKLAYLIGESVQREPSDLLSDRLFFL